jgi:hypothetical protein
MLLVYFRFSAWLLLSQFVDKILLLPNHLIKNFQLRNHFVEFFTL